MPTYVCSTRPGLLDDGQKQALAEAITAAHAQATGAPAYYVQVVIDEKATAKRFIAGKPTDDHVWIRGDIRAGRTIEQRSTLVAAIARDAARIAGVPAAAVWVYLCNLEPTDMVEFGQALPKPGEEQAWFDALPEETKGYLRTLRH